MIIQWFSSSTATSEALRFAIVGVKNNLVYYLLYIGLSVIGVGHELAVVAVYVFGILYSFLFNKNFVFRNHRPSKSTFAKYVLVYLLALILNLISLRVLTEFVGLNHYVAQGILIFAISAVVFVLLRLVVFRTRGGEQA